ncbi:hypothetical protein MBLNU459_g1002t3 [Dothideomycetes sp. NU459]
MASNTPGGHCEADVSADPDSHHRATHYGGVALPFTTIGSQYSFAQTSHDQSFEQQSGSDCHSIVSRNDEEVAEQHYVVPHVGEVPKLRHFSAQTQEPWQSESGYRTKDWTGSMDPFLPSRVPSCPFDLEDKHDQHRVGLGAMPGTITNPMMNQEQYSSLRKQFNSKPNTAVPGKLDFQSAQRSPLFDIRRKSASIPQQHIAGLGASSCGSFTPLFKPVFTPSEMQSDSELSFVYEQSSSSSTVSKATSQHRPSHESHAINSRISQPGRTQAKLPSRHRKTLDGETVTEPTSVSPLGSLTSYSFAAPTTPKTTETKEDRETQGTSSSAHSTDTESPSQKAPIWREKQMIQSWKLQRCDRNKFERCFKGAFDVLGTMNPDHYQMPFGSRVVSIKSVVVSNILLSLRTGVWACPDPVKTRIVKLAESRSSEEEKILFLYSVPGSKHFCGLAEMLSYQSGMSTDQWEGDTVYSGAMLVRWLYCKFVTYDEIRRTVVFDEDESVTQMWNGMHYPESTGRKVIQAYTKAPHIENILTKPFANHPRRDKARKKRGTTGSGKALPDHTRQPTTPRFGGSTEMVGSKADRTDNKKTSPIAAAPGSEGQHRSNSDGKTVSSSISIDRVVEKPKVQTMPFHVNFDDIATPRVSLNNSNSGMTQYNSGGVRIKSLSPASTPRTPFYQDDYSNEDSSVGDAPNSKTRIGSIVGERNRPHHPPPTSISMRKDRGQSAKGGVRIGTPNPPSEPTWRLQTNWRSGGLQHDCSGQKALTRDNRVGQWPAASLASPLSSELRNMEHTSNATHGSPYMHHDFSPRKSSYMLSDTDNLNEGSYSQGRIGSMFGSSVPASDSPSSDTRYPGASGLNQVTYA